MGSADGDSLDDAEAVLAHVGNTIGTQSTEWAGWPGGWPDDIESALIDAVFSARAVYKTSRGRGVHRLVTDWQATRSRRPDLRALAAEIDEAGVTAWARRFGSEQLSPSRPEAAPGGRTKAATVLQAARALTDTQVYTADDVTADARGVLMAVPGIGRATAGYFLMLLGTPGVKPDRMIHRFLHTALGRHLRQVDAESVIGAVAVRLEVEPHELDHAIWRYESSKAAQARTGPVLPTATSSR